MALFAIDFGLSVFSLLAGRVIFLNTISGHLLKTTGAGFLRGPGAVNISELTL